MKSAHDCFTNPLINHPKNNRARGMGERERPNTPVVRDSGGSTEFAEVLPGIALGSVVGSSVSRQSQDREPVDERQAGPKITVVVVDDHPVIREGLVEILNSQTDISVVGQAGDGFEACTVYSQLLPDVLMLDLRLPKKEGVQVLRELASLKVPMARVIIMTSFDTEHDVCQAARAGAKAFLHKMADPEQIREVVRRVARGEKFFPPDIGLRLVEAMSQAELSRREIQVLEKLANGRSNKEIGSALQITEGTVKYHVKAILGKLDAIGRAEAIAIAVRRGLVRMS
jgi:DNA-binding NarL/FixJ family response regulator